MTAQEPALLREIHAVERRIMARIDLVASGIGDVKAHIGVHTAQISALQKEDGRIEQQLVDLTADVDKLGGKVRAGDDAIATRVGKLEDAQAAGRARNQGRLDIVRVAQALLAGGGAAAVLKAMEAALGI